MISTALDRYGGKFESLYALLGSCSVGKGMVGGLLILGARRLSLSKLILSPEAYNRYKENVTGASQHTFVRIKPKFQHADMLPSITVSIFHDQRDLGT